MYFTDKLSMTVQLEKVLKRLMKDRQETAASLSKTTRIPITTLRNWTFGTLPSAKNLHHIITLATYFDVSVAE